MWNLLEQPADPPPQILNEELRGVTMFRSVMVVLAIASLLGGCSNSIDALTATPTPTQVSVFASETGSLTVTDADRVRPMYSSEYLLASINYTNQKCDEFFDKLARFQQDSSFVDKVLAPRSLQPPL
jgi:hypothetical protein